MFDAADQVTSQAFIDSIGAPVYLVDVGDDGSFTMFALNRRCRDYLGVRDEAAPPMSPEDVFGPGSGAASVERWRECVEAASELTYEAYWEPAAGPRWGRVTLVPILSAAGRVARLMATVVDVTELKESEMRVQWALTRVISGYVPICAHCKSIKDDGDEWLPVEAYVRRRTDARFSHGICPRCLSEHFPDLTDEPGG